VRRGEHDVLRLDVAVHDTFFVRRLQPFSALRGNVEELLRADWLRQALAQGGAFDVLHD